jgi:hypothetical protein
VRFGAERVVGRCAVAHDNRRPVIVFGKAERAQSLDREAMLAGSLDHIGFGLAVG